MLEAVAAAAEVPAAVVRRAFMLSGRLPETARSRARRRRARARGRRACRSAGPVRPMLACPGDSLDAALAGLGPDVTVEYKLDGARIQVHRDGDDVRVWTRTLREITEGVPELVAQVRALPAPRRRARRRDPRARRRRPPPRVPGHDEPLRQRRVFR